MSANTLGWLLRASVLVHVAAVVVWFGAVAYFLLVLRPSMRAAGLDRKVRYALLVAIKARLRRVVGGAVVAIVVTGFANAWLSGLLTGRADAFHRRVFAWKLGLAGALIAIFLVALPALRRVRTGKLRGRLFVLVHVVVLVLGALAAGAGILLAH